ncbi:SMP-30/gluconolactonase/LRE family protein [Nordella sp. HKS 07]|uniref:SMP-30/gluconolactonase/LRE family protein n=1 Tax=Nordella sp. HKS 07 TaxID=2712222 RepID=UPI0013E19572|nr:SMP-30/gluconolactonase/LRE family protein [Nordella sp. HKS 07]QIG46757.1 SMP-30/gluconolactonase/LRE family protein [Nordella sp. HKS 07]
MKNYRIVNRDVRCVVDSRDKIGEGVFWCPQEQAAYWLDVPMPSVLHRFVPSTGRHDSWPMPEMITAMAKRADGSLLVASQGGINFFDPKTGKLNRKVAPEADQPLNRSNDGAPDARGRFWMGTMMNNLGPAGEDMPITAASGALWCIQPDLSARKVISDIKITNGVVWNPQSSVLYVADSALQIIYAYDFDLERGTVANRREFSAIKDLGYPDGAAVDSEGYLWSARWEGHCVARLAPDGTVDQVVTIPAVQVTSCAFGGADLKTLYVTSAHQGLRPELAARYPQQGSLFAFEAPVTGLPRPRFAG